MRGLPQLLDCAPQRLTVRVQPGPYIADSGHAPGHLLERERLRTDVTALHLLPRAGRGDRRAALRPHGIRSGVRRMELVTTGVDQNATAAIRLKNSCVNVSG